LVSYYAVKAGQEPDPSNMRIPYAKKMRCRFICACSFFYTKKCNRSNKKSNRWHDKNITPLKLWHLYVMKSVLNMLASILFTRRFKQRELSIFSSINSKQNGWEKKKKSFSKIPRVGIVTFNHFHLDIELIILRCKFNLKPAAKEGKNW